MAAMATVRPFPAVHYEPTRVADAGLVTCPPYDVISDADRERLYARHPYNVVRIVSPRDDGGDRYAEAADFFRSWLWEGVLRKDAVPAIYVYRQAFTDPAGRFRRVWGLVAEISLDDRVLAHERTMPGPKADRLALMRAIPANLSPIYALYREECSGPVAQGLPDFASEAPIADFVDDEGTRHTVWAAHDSAFHEQVAKALAPCPLLIADGHHRFETAKRYREERGGPGPWDSIMVLLVDAGTQPVCILPYHRIVLRATSDPLAVLEQGFDVSPVSGDAVALGLELWDDDRPGVFIVFAGDRAYRVVARDAAQDEIPAAVLRRLALEPLGARFAEGDLAFTPRAEEVAAEVSCGRAACGFLMQPVAVDRVWDLAVSDPTHPQMPEKSTYFHPKPRDGIVIRVLE
jgi:uncharacterized protein (DUF1015 family)